MTSAPADRLLAPYRPVRRVSAGEDGPWSGLLIKLASGESRVLVDADGLPDEWAGWSAAPEGHLLTPLDIIRREDGQDVMLPQCVERVEDFLARRAASRVPLSSGETVTLGVSLVRGFAAWADVSQGSGEWWLTDTGRPMLAAGRGERNTAAHTSALLFELAERSPWAAAVAVAAQAVGSERVSARDLQDAEDQLFAVADPEPLATTLLGPRSARDLVAFDRLPAEAVGDPVRGSRWVDVLARQVDADLADAFSRATTGVWRRLRTRGEGSRRPWLLATGAAGVVLAAGLLWPTGAGNPATAGDAISDRADPAATAAAPQNPTSDPAPTEDIDDRPTEPADLVTIADELLAARAACAGESACLAELTVDPTTQFAAGAADLGPSERVTTLLDEFGAVAVLRVEAVATASEPQLVVIMLRDGRWLLRDIHAAKQP